MSSIHLIAIEAALLVSAMAFTAWLLGKAHGAAIQVYSGVADGVRLSSRTRRLTLINVWSMYIILAIVTDALIALALLQIGEVATYSEAVNVAHLFALVLFVAAAYLLVSGVMVVFSLAKMIDLGRRGELVS
jgi:hypothetical protein